MSFRPARTLTAAVSVLAIAAPPQAAFADGPRVAPTAHRQAAPAKPIIARAPEAARELRIHRGGEGAGARALTLGLGKAIVVDLPAEARDVLLSEPLIADAVMRTASRAYIIGRKVGQTNVFFFDSQGRQIANLEIRVEPDVRGLHDLLRAAAPDARVSVESVNGTIVLSGNVGNASEADRIVQIATRYLSTDQAAGAAGGGGGAGSTPLVNLLTIQNEEQVLLKVRMVEMSRSLVKQLGVNLNAQNIINEFLPEDVFAQVATANGFSINGTLLGGVSGRGGVADTVLTPLTLAPPSNPLPAPPGTATSGAGGAGDLIQKSQVDAAIAAFERVGLLRVLAEPNVTAVSGESGSFLAGGEFPIPVGQEDGKISIEFKPFGVGLAFTPVVLGNGRISLKLSTEVSETTGEGAISANGLVIPALQVRRAETTVEVPSGGAMVIAGLIQERTRQALEGVPGAKDMPGLGALFRSRDFVNAESELVIIVTPYIVRPTSPDKLRTPSDGYQNPTDIDAIFRGRINQVYSNPASDTEGHTLKGRFGFRLPEMQPPKLNAPRPRLASAPQPAPGSRRP
jgi:pilus assembly protein CpaC